jgi:hypothetical protein
MSSWKEKKTGHKTKQNGRFLSQAVTKELDRPQTIASGGLPGPDQAADPAMMIRAILGRGGDPPSPATKKERIVRGYEHWPVAGRAG